MRRINPNDAEQEEEHAMTPVSNDKDKKETQILLHPQLSQMLSDLEVEFNRGVFCLAHPIRSSKREGIVEIGPVHTVEIFHAIGESSTCRHLRAFRVAFEDSDWAALADLIRKNNSVESINLQSNRIGPTILRQLSSSFSANRTLRSLILDYNNLTSNGSSPMEFVLFVRSLDKHHTLEYLSFISCCITDECVEVLSACLSGNRSIIQVNLNLNKIDWNLTRKIEDICSRNRKERDIRLEAAKIHVREMTQADSESKKLAMTAGRTAICYSEAHSKMLSDATSLFKTRKS